MKLLNCILWSSVVSGLLGTSALSVQLEEIQLPLPPQEGEVPALGLLSLGLDRWGTKDEKQILDPLEAPAGHWLSLVYGLGGTKLRMLLLLAICTFFFAGLYFALWRCGWRTPALESTDANLDLASVVEIGTGSWVHMYRISVGEQKEALELLFRCKIISANEFAYSRASQDHIDECSWIATQMLRQKPLEEWIARRQQALQSFEDSITAIFAARTTSQQGKEGPVKQGKDEDEEAVVPAPVTPPLQGAFKDLLSLKGGFQSPLVRSNCNSNVSTAQNSPVMPGCMPTSESSQDVPLKAEDLDITFVKQDGTNNGPQPRAWPPSETRRSGSQVFRPAAPWARN
jgi:hypothetical protein